ncbi:conserved Plasmodium protein, unknown function [Plasmodium gallinaceum]|uniref:Uncharacterized protein n=1 Tax=Plasmodium gallinaceum TaxID=5849 RepID=A0A1J1GZA7_PLAGA|nr:conserved Plasmodium protein, unknown function [Plasmodium gallinaceum]CRG97902.1 conserved Plasmodium protein, unknown function [Plasmodium gallinaceum]
MEKYKLFFDEIKEENKKIAKKIIFVNNKIKYKVLNNRKIEFYKYFINSYEDEKKKNVYKYYKHKIVNSKKKKKYLDNNFPYFEIYKNTNDAFKNNFQEYNIFKIIKDYDELKLFDFCSKNNIKNCSHLFSHFIEIIIKKRDLYNINNVLLLTNSIRKLNYYHPYFCKLICREVHLDIYKIKDINKITDFINFLMHFNIFNFYYLNKIYKYIIYLITQNNEWKIINSNNSDLKKKLHITEEITNNPNNSLIPINNNNVIILLKSFLKYKYFDINLLKLLIYICNHDKYIHLKNIECLYYLSKLSEHYNFINKDYSSDFFNIFKNVINDKLNYNDFILLLKTFYNIYKTYNTIELDHYNLIIQNYKHLEKEILMKNSLVEVSYDNYILINSNKKEKVMIKNKNKGKDKDYSFIKVKNNKLIKNETFLPFNNTIDTNLKKQNINSDYLILHYDNEIYTSDINFYNLFDTVKYIILFIELKILKFAPFKKKSLAEIEFLKRKNFERDNEKNIYKYISQNINEEQNENMEYILRKNKQENFDDSNLQFLFYLNYLNHEKFKKEKNKSEFEGNIQEKKKKENKEIEEKTEIQKKKNISSEDINNYLNDKKNIKFNLNDNTYFSHIFNNLSSIQLANIEDHILNKSFKFLLLFKNNLQILDVNDIADLFYSLTVFQIIQGYQKGIIKKNKYGYYKIKDDKENEELYKVLSNILIKKLINIKEENLYKIILSCANTAYSNYYLKNFNRYIKFSKMRKLMNC